MVAYTTIYPNSLILLDLSCSSLSDLRDSEEVAKALKTAVGSKQVHISPKTLLSTHTAEVL